MQKEYHDRKVRAEEEEITRAEAEAKRHREQMIRTADKAYLQESVLENERRLEEASQRRMQRLGEERSLFRKVGDCVTSIAIHLYMI
mgnify:CR=1 FL=1